MTSVDTINLPLHTYNQILIDNAGVAQRIKGVSAFNLCDLYCKGQDPSLYTVHFPGSNLVRVFLYTPVKDWGDTAWGIPPHQKVAEFIQRMRDLGFLVKLVLLTDDDPVNIAPARDLVSYLTQFNFGNLILAAGNEPLTHKNINVNALKTVLANTGYLYTSGVYEDLAKFYGNCGDDHSGRDSEWVRKAKDVVECYRGGGPNYPEEPACKVPWILGEPIKPTEAQDFPYDTQLDYYTYGALCGQMGAGGIFHFEGGKFCRLPNEFERECYEYMLAGLNTYPNDTALGNYDKIVEDPNTLRTYTVGNTAVRVRPVSGLAPLQGYRALDQYGICWTK